MIVYNISAKVEAVILETWLSWIAASYVPSILATGYFTSYCLYRLRDPEDETAPTFILQFGAGTMENYQDFMNGPADEIGRRARQRWGEQFLTYHTCMEELNQ